MGFFGNLLGKKSTKEFQVKGFKEIGKVDCCPYCKEKLDKIPTRKKKCPNCKKFIFSRTRPSDRKKILVTEKQKKEVEAQWVLYHEIKKEADLMEDPDFASAKKELTIQFGKEPFMNDVKWRVFNQRIVEYASKKQWGFYRNNKLDIALLLQKENKSKQALNTLFEVIYLDINGCHNIGTIDGKILSQKEMDNYNIKEFYPKSAFIAPRVIKSIQDLISELKLSMKQTEEMFCSINKKMKPVKNMPITEEKAWGKILKRSIFKNKKNW